MVDVFVWILLSQTFTSPVAGIWPIWNPPDNPPPVPPKVDYPIVSTLQVDSPIVVPPIIDPGTCTTPPPIPTTQRYNPNKAGDVRIPGHYVSPSVRIGVVLAQELLRLYMHYTTARFKRDTFDLRSSLLARDSLRLGLLAYMGYHGEQECVERAACEVGELVGRYIPSVPLVFAALDYIAPRQYRPLVRMAKDAAEGEAGCVYYRCGVLPYLPDRPQ